MKTNNWPLVSIIVPAYNHEKFVKRCLDSIIEEAYPNKEIVIINDGSTDNTDSVIQSWVNNNKQLIPTKYINRENKGLTRTLNELLELSAGKYIVIVASDDYLLNNGISKRYDYLIQHPEKKGVFGDCIVVDENERLLYDSGLSGFHSANKKRLSTDKGIRLEFIINWSVPGPVLMLKKDTYNVVGKYDESLQVEDWDFYLRMASKNLIGFLDETVSAYRVHGKNICMIKENRDTMWNNRVSVTFKNFWLFNLVEQYYLFRKFIFPAVLMKVGLIRRNNEIKQKQ